MFSKFAKPCSTVGSLQDLRTGGRWLDPRLGQYSFPGLMKVVVTEFIPLSPLSIVSTMVMWESSQWLGKNIVLCWVRLKEPQESIDRCTGRRNIIEILLETTLNTAQSIFSRSSFLAQLRIIFFPSHWLALSLSLSISISLCLSLSLSLCLSLSLSLSLWNLSSS